ncbi:MAG: DNA internalization-related competence protein ComEC/Rec2 [Pseudoflavonifractor capillosus]|uniref:DNA internalization-related competence protein ComEC/Rec2 n=1 Tax=Pseudoflavonifractor capillosus TaxID=106588 RepID=UPI0023F6D82D|nr:DNA internalization-related competence protein ComEC/Rec2 [Pseudoflavonifractor capillosus]MCI5927579.1 DNA internalization-related competence protein ComEC/Rec2 [Pseudoflavonifractor capillosus]MDY4660438.1 DNA internalization-related competence protein ComEC/Rec2 [Pseudoflavonifractor capillosus]
MRKLASFALPFGVGIFLSAYLLPRTVQLAGAALCALIWVVCLLCWRRQRVDKRLRPVLYTAGLAIALLWSWGYDMRTVYPAEQLAGTEETFVFQAADWPETGTYSVSVEARLLNPDGPDLGVLLYFYPGDEKIPDIKPGDTLTCTVQLKLADTVGGEENGYYYSKGIFLTANAAAIPEVTPAENVPLKYWPALWRRAMGEHIAELFSDETAGLALALTTGDKSGLTGGFYTALKRCGLAHVVAVSGMHMSMVVMLAAMLVRRRRRKLMAIVSIPLVLVFMALTGFAPSVVRAGVMQILLLLGPALSREGDTVTSLSFALLLLLLQNPYAAMSVGLQLSFLSVVGILTITGRLNEKFFHRFPLKKGKTKPRRLYNRAVRFLVGCVTMSIGAIAFTTPLTVCYFGTVSLISPLANLLTLWAVTVLFLLCLPAAALGGVLPIVGKALAALAEPVSWLFHRIVYGLSSLPFASVSLETGRYILFWLLFVYAVIGVCILFRKEKPKPIVPVCCCAIALSAALMFNALSLRGDGLAVTVLDVGQGQSILLTTSNSTALVDCGGSGGDDPGDIAADYVQAMGKSTLDLLVLTHYHSDHACGVPELMERLDVAALAVPDVEPDSALRAEILALAEEKGTEVIFIEEDTTVELDSASLTLYAPLGTGGGNEEGLSVLATQGDFDALITGDMNAAVERRLVKYGNLPDIELLVAGHHGSASSTSAELLEAVMPEYAVISVGYNTYGHPAPETLDRLERAGCTVWRTDLRGTITIRATD